MALLARFAALLAFCGLARGLGAPDAYRKMSDAEVSAAIARAHGIEPLAARLEKVTEPFLGTPYVLGNMGEGPDGDGRDKDPRYNVQAADCTTFVEHGMAFALARDLPEARKLLDAIRYDHGKVDYGQRRHWPEAQWVRGLIAEGYLEDVTAQVAGGPVPEVHVKIDPQILKASAHDELKEKLRPDEVPVGDFSVPYVPIDKMAGAHLSGGLVINIVKADKPGLLTHISHQGLVLERGGKLVVRNATSVGPRAVTDEPLDAFVARQAAARSWPTLGFNFLRVKDRP